MNFDVCGPFEIPRNKTKTRIDEERLGELDKAMEEEYPGLSSACGCYVFVMHAGKGYKPWYIGQTKSPSILKEAFNSRNINAYNGVLDKIKSGTPMIFFIPTLTRGGAKYRKPNRQLKSIDFLEKWLIGEAFQKNVNIINIRDTKFLKDLHVKGVFNAKHGESDNSSKELRRAVWR